MSLDQDTMRPRRAVLGAALGLGAATVASALGHPELVRAGTDGDVVLGGQNDATAVTTIVVSATQAPAFRAECLTGPGVHGLSQGGPAVLGEGITGTTQPGVLGISYYTGPGVCGWSELGPSGTATPTGYPLRTGVFGSTSADSPLGRGVFGRVTDGQGVRGEATKGVGVYATASSGIGLQVVGKVRLNRSGRANVAPRGSYVDVVVPGGIASNTVITATIQTYRAGVAVAGVRPNYPSAGRARIYLTKVASTTASTPVGWIATEYGG